MKITLIKIARYGSEIPNDQKYNFYCVSAQQKIDPDIDQPISYRSSYRLGEYSRVYSSPLKRALSSAHYLSQRVIVVPQLAEVTFDLTRLLTAHEYNHSGSTLVRERFVQAFVQDTLIESRQEIIGRAQFVVKSLTKNNQKKVVCVSHSFFMKILEAYLSGVDLLHNPSAINNFIVPDFKTYQHGGGFTINVQSTGGEI